MNMVLIIIIYINVNKTFKNICLIMIIICQMELYTYLLVKLVIYIYYIIYYCLFDERYIVMLDRVPTYIYITSTSKSSSSSTSSSSAISFARV
jgi:hypothetical protein